MFKRICLIVLSLIIGLIVVYFITEPKESTWIYTELPNSYVIKKYGEDKIQLGKILNNKFSFKYGNKMIGVSDYIAEFSYGNNYIGLKCVEKVDGDIIVKFYIVDTSDEYVYGPYNDLETYLKVSEKIVDDEMCTWIKVTDL